MAEHAAENQLQIPRHAFDALGLVCKRLGMTTMKLKAKLGILPREGVAETRRLSRTGMPR